MAQTTVDAAVDLQKERIEIKVRHIVRVDYVYLIGMQAIPRLSIDLSSLSKIWKIPTVLILDNKPNQQ